MDYINDVELYKAVMYACKLMKPPYNKNHSTAIGIASKTYKVNYADINHCVSQRGGRKNGTKIEGNYKYYICGEFVHIDNEDAGYNEFQNRILIKKAIKLENIRKRIKEINKYSHLFYEAMEKEFENKNKAEQYLENNKNEIRNYFKSKEY